MHEMNGNPLNFPFLLSLFAFMSAKSYLLFISIIQLLTFWTNQDESDESIIILNRLKSDALTTLVHDIFV